MGWSYVAGMALLDTGDFDSLDGGYAILVLGSMQTTLSPRLPVQGVSRLPLATTMCLLRPTGRGHR